MLETILGNNFDIFVLCFLGQVSFMFFSFNLILKFFQTPDNRIRDSIKVISIFSISVYFFYEFFRLIFHLFGIGLRVFPITCSLIISFFVFKIVFQTKYRFYGREKDIIKIFLTFLFTNILSLLLIFYILNWFKII